MGDQSSQLSHPIPTGRIPAKWQERFLLKRIDEEDIVITLAQRDAILGALDAGARFVQIGKYTLMLNGIKSIDPYWPPNNVPPRPGEEHRQVEIKDNKIFTEVVNQDEIDLWDQLFARKEPNESSTANHLEPRGQAQKEM